MDLYALRVQTIVTTEVYGMSPSIKQFVSGGDYMITLEGVLSGTNPYQTDTKRIAQLDAIMRYGQSIKIDSIYVNNLFDVIDVVVMD